ncbi:MAG: hypothetical protein OER59_02655, partial [Desulfobulbaceae bacterium]|nr:hypothetical protein [Desulfobulbaceae bacterium]
MNNQLHLSPRKRRLLLVRLWWLPVAMRSSFSLCHLYPLTNPFLDNREHDIPLWSIKTCDNKPGLRVKIYFSKITHPAFEKF